MFLFLFLPTERPNRPSNSNSPSPHPHQETSTSPTCSHFSACCLLLLPTGYSFPYSPTPNPILPAGEGVKGSRRKRSTTACSGSRDNELAASCGYGVGQCRSNQHLIWLDKGHRIDGSSFKLYGVLLRP
jgi:hypothetical protein